MSLIRNGISPRPRSCCATSCGVWSDPNAGDAYERSEPIPHSIGVILHGSTDEATTGEPPHHRKLPRHLSLADAICTTAAAQSAFTVDCTGHEYSVPRRVS